MDDTAPLRLTRPTTIARLTFAAPPVLLAREHPTGDLRHEVERGAVVRLRRGAYVAGDLGGPGQVLAEARARAAIVATHRRLNLPFWFSHESAALVWGCVVWPAPSATHVVQEQRPGGRAGERDTLVRHHRAVPVAERAQIDGLPVTSLARTVVDCARTMPAGAALALADSALRLGVAADDVEHLLREPGGRGVRRARRVWAAADARAESPGESMTRWILALAGLAPTDLQVPVQTTLGVFFPDLCWPEVRFCVEFDGAGKYGDGEAVAAAVLREKRRQDALEEAGWMVVRVTWADLQRPDQLVARVRAALVRARRRS